MNKIIFPHEHSFFGLEVISNDSNCKGTWPIIKLVAKDQRSPGDLATILPLVLPLDQYPEPFRNCHDIVSNSESLIEGITEELNWVPEEIREIIKNKFSSSQD